MQLTNQVAIVTGASRGIGRAIAIKLAQKGANVVINYAGSVERAEQVKHECESLGAQVLLQKGSVADAAFCQQMVEETVKTFGKVDILVNNAGITKDNLMMRMSEQDFNDVLDVNLKGTFHCMKAVCRPMMKQRSGRIINMTSVVGITGNAGQANYAASKAGVIGLTKSMAKELASRDICINAIAPGFIQTDMTDVLPENVKENLKQNIPLARLGKPEDIANLVAFLASEEASYITGQVIHVDGGMVM